MMTEQADTTTVCMYSTGALGVEWQSSHLGHWNVVPDLCVCVPAACAAGWLLLSPGMTALVSHGRMDTCRGWSNKSSTFAGIMPSYWPSWSWAQATDWPAHTSTAGIAAVTACKGYLCNNYPAALNCQFRTHLNDKRCINISSPGLQALCEAC